MRSVLDGASRAWLLGFACLLVGCGDSAPEQPNVLFVTIDTLRQDRLGCYGYEGGKTPRLDALAEAGARFDNAYTCVPITLPSHTSMFTGNYPFVHNVKDNAIARVHENNELLAERFKTSGYDTAAFISAVVLDANFGLNQGFDVYEDDVSDVFASTGSMPDRPAGRTNEKVFEWLGSRSGDKPFFAWVHYFDPHLPWEAPADVQREIADGYDAEVAYTDREFGKLLDRLERDGLLDDTLIVVTSDHGEGLGEHGEETHGFYLYDSTIKVPLIFKGPGVSPGAIKGLTRTIDLAPTLLELCGLPLDTPMQGTSLAAACRGEDMSWPVDAYAETFLPAYGFGWSWQEAIRVSDRQAGREGKFIDSPKAEYFDFAADPSEETNLYGQDAQRDSWYRNALARLKSDVPEGVIRNDSVEVDEGTVDLAQLEELGYVLGGSKLPESRGQDVKDVYWSLRLREEGVALYAQKRFREALDKFRTFKEQTSNQPARAQELLGSTLAALAHERLNLGLDGQDLLKEAVLELEECLERMPRYYDARLALALCYRQLGAPDKFLTHIEKALEVHPKSKPAHHFAGMAAMGTDPDKAIGHFRAHLDLWKPNPNEPDLYAPISAILLGNIYYDRKDFAEAASAYRRAMTIQPGFADAEFYLGRLADAAGDPAVAKDHYKRFLSLVEAGARPPQVLVQHARQRLTE